MPLILSNEDVEELFTMQDCLECLEEAYVELGHGRAIGTPRIDTLTPHAERDGFYAFKQMGGVVPKFGVQALRINSDVVHWPVIDGKARREKIPAAPGRRWVGLVQLYSTKNGELLAIFPDGVIQRMRVAATNGLGTKLLARRDAETLAILGSGWQAGTQVQAHRMVRPIRRIKVYSPNRENRERFAAEYSPVVGIEIEPVGSAAEAVEGADVIAAATNSMHPVLEEGWVRPGVHFSCIKAQEVTGPLLRRCDRVAFHTTSQIKQDTYVVGGVDRNPTPEVTRGWWNDGSFDWQDRPDLARLLAGKAPGRQREDEVTAFVNNVGMGFQFAAVGARLLEKARAAGRGRELPGDWFTQTVHP